MKVLPYNPILIYKEQGRSQPDNLDNLADDDFLLCIQTEFQRDMQKAFEYDTVCIDITHGTNIYHFNLITLVVIDEYGEGIPVAWMLSNREDTISLIPFFEAIKCSSGVITPSRFMSDDADNYFNAWKAVFGEGDTKKILCAWHIDRTWRKALVETVREKEDQIKIYHQLSILLNERDEAKFRVTLQAFLTHLQTEHARFFAYFTTNYCSRLPQWAAC